MVTNVPCQNDAGKRHDPWRRHTVIEMSSSRARSQRFLEYPGRPGVLQVLTGLSARFLLLSESAL